MQKFIGLRVAYLISTHSLPWLCDLIISDSEFGSGLFYGPDHFPCSTIWGMASNAERRGHMIAFTQYLQLCNPLSRPAGCVRFFSSPYTGACATTGPLIMTLGLLRKRAKVQRFRHLGSLMCFALALGLSSRRATHLFVSYLQ